MYCPHVKPGTVAMWQIQVYMSRSVPRREKGNVCGYIAAYYFEKSSIVRVCLRRLAGREANINFVQTWHQCRGCVRGSEVRPLISIGQLSQQQQL